jgi:hypothetical protein
MSQAHQNIAASPNSDKTPADTAMAAAMTAARETTKPRAAANTKPQGRAQANRSGKANPQATNGQANPSTRRQPVRQAITLELVQAHAPHAGLAANLSRTFGIEPIDYAAIREGTEENIVRSANVLRDDLNDKAMEMHLQRIVGAFVSSAYGAATFYQNKVTTARDLTVASQNDDRDEDRDGVAGFESKAERARIFAAEMGLQAYALLAAAEGAVHAYAHMTGDTWKPYEAPVPTSSNVSRRSAAEELAAFGG